MLKIDVWPQARDFVEALSMKHRRQVAAKLLAIAKNPFPPQSKLLEGYAPLRRIKSGDYRIIYFVDGDFLKVPLMDKRGDDAVYRRLKRLFG